jgi:hypothetical protein
MKTKATIIIVIAACMTLSFTFASVKKNDTKAKYQKVESVDSKEPLGGFVSQDQL